MEKQKEERTGCCEQLNRTKDELSDLYVLNTLTVNKVNHVTSLITFYFQRIV